MRKTKVFTLKSILSKTSTVLLGVFMLAGAALADTGSGSSGDSAQGAYSSQGGSPWATYYRFLEENPEIYAEADTSFPQGMTKYGKNGETEKNVDGPRIPGKIWPIITQPYVPRGPEKTMNWAKTMDRITGYSKEPIGSVNLSPAFAALSLGTAGQMLADQLQSPQATMPRAREEQNQQIQLSADNTAAMERQQAGSAIDFVASYLYNFTVEEGNKWNQVRNKLFLPMALLLLLPGAILAQVKSIASQGFNVLGEISPFDGLTRSVIAIFLIPGTYLIVNYGIDVANSITKTVAEEYQKIFGTNMYEDAMCSHIRAFPFREPIENNNFVPNQEAKMGRLGPNNTPFAELEGKMIDIKLTDPCAKLNIVPKDRANEQVKYSVNAQRNAYNTANAALAMAWNILCAFQMAYLYYLWFVGPVVAALWVYPMKQLRDAFPSWCEGVITICFWSLFWSTTVLLMACFRGVDETGTIIMTALNFLATACVKFAFDFAGLVKDAGREAGRMAERMASAAASGGKGAQGSHGNTQNGANGNNAHGAPGQNGNHGAPNAMPGAGDETGVATGGTSGSPFALEGEEFANGANGGLPMTANGGGINGQVSMHDFPHPPLNGHHHNALGVVGTALGGAALFTGLAAMAQPHFMHGSVPPAGFGPHPGGGDGNTGVAGAGPHANADDGKGVPIASAAGAGVDFDQTVVHEGDEYEHNWGEAAINAPIASASLTPDGPPLSSLPVGPNVSLTPDVTAALGMPPSSGVEGQTAGMQAIIGAAGGPDVQGSTLVGGAPNLVANAEGVGNVGVHNVGAPVPGMPGAHGVGAHGEAGHVVAHGHGHGGHGHGHDPHHAAGLGHGQNLNVAGDQIAHHNAHHAAHNQNHAHELNNLNAMFRDTVATNAASYAAANAAAASAASASGAANLIASTSSSFNTTDLSSVANIAGSAQQQSTDYSIANANSSSTVGGSTAYGATTNVDNSYASGNSNYYDPSQASFSALAQSVAGDSVTYVDDGSGVGYTDAGMSTTSAAGDYSTNWTANTSSSYGTDYSSYGTDYSSSTYGTDYSTAYGADYTNVVDDDTYVDNSAAYAMPTTVSANISAIDNSSTSNDSYSNALSAGGFVAPPPDGATTQINANASSMDVYNNAAVNANADIYNNALSSSQSQITSNADVYSNVAVNNTDAVSNLSQQQQIQPQSGIPATVGDVQISSQQSNANAYHTSASAEIVMNGSVSHNAQTHHVQNSMEANVANVAGSVIGGAAAGAAGSIFRNENDTAQQQLRNKLAYPGDPSGKPGLNPPKNVKVTPPGGKQIAGTAGGAKQSALGAALGKANTQGTGQNAKPGAGQMSKPMPVVKPASKVGSLQDAMQHGNTRNRYVQSAGLTEEELAELEAKARESGTWMPTE